MLLARNLAVMALIAEVIGVLPAPAMAGGAPVAIVEEVGTGVSLV